MYLWIVATVCAFFVKGLCGFSNTLVFTSILAFGHANISISPVELLLVTPSNFILAWNGRKGIKWSVSIPLALLVLAGSVPGILFLKNADTLFVKQIFGVVIILIGAVMLVKEFQQKKLKQSKIVTVIVGILSGVLCGLYGVGALLGAYMSSVTEDSPSFKATMCVVFLTDNLFRVILYSAWGIITLPVLKYALILAPCMVLGLFLGIKSSKIIDEKILKKIVIITLIISGIALLFTNT